jgi:hypothetical protein
MRGNPLNIDVRKIPAVRQRGHNWRTIADSVDLFAICMEISKLCITTQ